MSHSTFYLWSALTTIGDMNYNLQHFLFAQKDFQIKWQTISIAAFAGFFPFGVQITGRPVRQAMLPDNRFICHNGSRLMTSRRLYLNEKLDNDGLK